MNFASRIVAWQTGHGRHGLPWQNTRDPYRIWLSEIMLQQTQVGTVIGYYQRFLRRFPDVRALAQASEDEVMPFWAGLGYYARARNLHRCARQIERDWGGRFPASATDIATLPGIGPSTAAAIAAFAYGERSPILDGNVKRVLTRHFGVAGDPARREIERRLWAIAHEQVAENGAVPLDMAAYTQGLMDLGATVCTRSNPGCARCPLTATCIAMRDGRQAELPTRKVRKAVPERRTAMLVLTHAGAVLLERRPSPGIWGGLWSLPEFDSGTDPALAARELGCEPQSCQALAAFSHTFSHYRLHISPWFIAAHAHELNEPAGKVRQWVREPELAMLGLPAPIKKLLGGLFTAGVVSH